MSGVLPYIAAAAFITGILSVAWAQTRSGAVAAWRSTAEGYKADVDGLKERLGRAEETITTLHAEIERQALVPDMTDALRAIEKASGEAVDKIRGIVTDDGDKTRARVTELKEGVDEISTRWG